MLEPWASIQNSYRGLGHPEATPVTVTWVPENEGDPGDADAVTLEQTAGDRVWPKPAKASYVPSRVVNAPGLLPSRAHTENW